MSFELAMQGDRELWLISGELPGRDRWVVPVYVDYFYSGLDNGSHPRKFARITRALPSMSSHVIDALKARLLPYMLKSDKGYCLISDSDLREIAEKAPGITPEFYYKFGKQSVVRPRELDMVEECQNDLPDSTERFLKFVQAQSQVVSWPTMKLVWRSIVQNSQVWLAENKEPIDFGFVELVPSPYRVNWTNILNVMHPAVAPVAHSKQNAAKKEVLIMETGFFSTLRNGIIMAITKQGWIHWRVECLHKDSWWKAMDAIESTARSSKGAIGYARHVASQIHKRISKSTELFAAWAKEAAKAAATVAARRTYGSDVLLPYTPKGHVTPAPPPEGKVSVMVNLEDKKLSGPTNDAEMADQATERLR